MPTEQPDPPTDPGEPCRIIDSCVPIELYYTYVGPAPELALGGPRSYVRSAGGSTFSVPTSQLTTAAPMKCDNFSHLDMHRQMRQIHVDRTRKAPSAPPGKNRRETPKERDARLARTEAYYYGRIKRSHT